MADSNSLHGGYANDRFMNHISRKESFRGIENPLERTLPANSTIYRFGGSERQASRGSWWFGQDQFHQIQDLALLNNLSFAYAARILTAVLHEYNDFTFLASAKTVVELRMYQGESLAQRGRPVRIESRLGQPVKSHQKLGEYIGKPVASLSTKFIQFCIPGLHDPALNAEALSDAHIVKVLAAEESHMFGTKGAPAGAMLQ